MIYWQNLLKRKNSWQHLTARKKISILIAAGFLLIGGWLTIKYADRLGMQAFAESSIKNQASLDYTNAAGQTQTVRSNSVSTIVIPPDTEPPSAPQMIGRSVSSSFGCGPMAKIGWTASTDNIGVVKYIIYKNSKQVAERPSNVLSFVDRFLRFNGSLAGDQLTMTNIWYTLTGKQNFIYGVQAVDAAGNASAISSQTLSYDFDLWCKRNALAAPTISNIAVTKNSDLSYTLKWSTDVPAYDQIAYGTTTNLGNMTEVGGLINANDHSSIFSLAQPLTTGSYYNFAIAALVMKTEGANFYSNVVFSGVLKFDSDGKVSDFSNVRAIERPPTAPIFDIKKTDFTLAKILSALQQIFSFLKTLIFK